MEYAYYEVHHRCQQGRRPQQKVALGAGHARNVDLERPEEDDDCVPRAWPCNESLCAKVWVSCRCLSYRHVTQAEGKPGKGRKELVDINAGCGGGNSRKHDCKLSRLAVYKCPEGNASRLDVHIPEFNLCSFSPRDMPLRNCRACPF